MSNNAMPFPGADPFTTFWSEFMQRMAAQGATPPNPSQEMFNTLRKSFFQAMAEYADQYMRSDQFMAQIKQSMDNAIAWQQMMNQYMQKGFEATPLPTRVDLDQVVQMIRGMESRVLEKIEEVSQRVEKVEAASGVKAKAAKA